MSLSLIIQNKDRIIIGGDSRGSIKEDGLIYATSDNVRKIIRIDDKCIFSAGSQWITQKTLETFQESSDRSIEKLKSIGIKITEEFERLYPDTATEIERKLEFIIATFENDISVIYSISSLENYRILRIEGENRTDTIGLGAHRDEAMKYCSLLKGLTSPFNMFERVYDAVSDEEVGGELTIYTLTKDSIKEPYIHKIMDRKPIKRYEVNPITSMNNATHGISISKGDGSGNNWTDMFWVDTEGNLHMKDAFIELIGTLATILLDPDVGLKITNDNGDMLFIDPETGKLKLAGDAEFAGNIKTSKNAYIGNNLYLGDQSQIGTVKRIYFNHNASIYSYEGGNGPYIAFDVYGMELVGNDIYCAGNFHFHDANVSGLEDSGYAVESDIKQWVTNNFVHV